MTVGVISDFTHWHPKGEGKAHTCVIAWLQQFDQQLQWRRTAVGQMGATTSIERTVTIDPDRLLDEILEVFVEYNNWLTFRQLASRLTGDQSNEDLVAGIVRRHSRVFIVNDGHRCKLRAVEDGDAVELPR